MITHWCLGFEGTRYGECSAEPYKGDARSSASGNCVPSDTEYRSLEQRTCRRCESKLLRKARFKIYTRELGLQAADYLVAARQALLGRRKFDAGENSEPLALLKALKAWRSLTGSPSDQKALCQTYALSAPRLKQLDVFAKALLQRVARQAGPALKKELLQRDDVDDCTQSNQSNALLRLLLTWSCWDQLAVLEPPASTPTPTNLVSRHALSGARVTRQQLAPLFPPIVRWRLAGLNTARVSTHETGIEPFQGTFRCLERRGLRRVAWGTRGGTILSAFWRAITLLSLSLERAPFGSLTLERVPNPIYTGNRCIP